MSRHSRSDKGAVAVEAALILPVLLTLLCGIIEFGLILSTQISLTQAVREGARISSFVATTDSAVRVRVREAANPVVVADVSITRTACPNPAGFTTVTVDHPYSLVTPIGILVGDGLFGDQGVGGTVNLAARGVMRCGG